MILNNDSLQEEIESIGVPTKSKVGGMKAANLSKFIDLITVQAYSNPEGSIVRELTSNCFDAHIKWQKKLRYELEDDKYLYQEPVIIAYTESEGLGYVSFIDYGTGLSPEQMDEIYIDIGTSDKEESNDYIGMYGVGSKSFLSYTPSIDLITKVDGIQYHYIVYKNEDGLLSYDLLIEEPTEDHNGTEVKVCVGKVAYRNIGYVNSQGQSYAYKAEGYPKFREEILKQLYYFDNVYTQGFDLDNDYRIYEADTFKIRSGLNPYKEIHIILGRVAYPIDWNILERKPLMIPVGVKFNIGELYVTVSRENIRYHKKENVAFINEQINKVVEEIKNRYNKNNTEVDSLEEYLRHRESANKLLIIEDVEIKLPKEQVLNKTESGYNSKDVIEGLNEVKWKPLAHLPINVPKDPYFIFYFKGILMQPDGKGNSKLATAPDENIFKQVNNHKDSVYRLKAERSKVTDNYLWWKHKNGSRPIFINKNKGFTLADYEKKLELWGEKEEVSKDTTKRELYSKKKIKTPVVSIVEGKNIFYGKTYLIQEYKKAITKDLLSRSQSYEKQELSAAYLYELQLAKIARKRPKLEGKITIYDLVNNNSSTSSELDLSKLERYKGFIIYGERDKLEILQGVKEMLSNIPPRSTPARSKMIPYPDKRMTQGEVVDEDTGEVVIGKVLKLQKWSYGGKVISRSYGGWKPNLRNEAGRIFITAKANHKLLQNNSYFMHVDEFMSNNNRMFRNAVTSWYIRRELDLIENENGNLYIFANKINDKLALAIEELTKWVDKNYKQYYSRDEFMEICLGIAKENGFLWEDKVDSLEKIKKWFSGDLQIFSHINEDVYNNPIIFKDVIALLKMKHKRLSAEHYFVPSEGEEVVLNQVEEAKTYQLLLEPMVKQLLIYNQRKQA